MPKHKLLYVAIADARGHLMRAHVLRGALDAVGVDVDVVTTSEEGAAFLRALGTPSTVTPGRFGIDIGAFHDVHVGRTRARTLQYFMRDIGCDIEFLRERARDCAFIVDDSLHPALLTARDLRVVHVHGENVRAMVCARARPLPIEQLLDDSFAEIVHALDDVDVGRRRLPPIVARPTPRRLEASTAAVYLNPCCSHPSIADFIERAVAEAGLALYGVSEAFAHRPGWRATDPDFIDVVAAADVLISGAGMGALEQSRATGTPLVCVLGKQDEQAMNARARGLATIQMDDVDAAAALTRALQQLPARRVVDACAEITGVQAMWTRVFLDLIKEADHEDQRNDRDDGPRDRNKQPRWWRRDRERLARQAARASRPAALHRR